MEIHLATTLDDLLNQFTAHSERDPTCPYSIFDCVTSDHGDEPQWVDIDDNATRESRIKGLFAAQFATEKHEGQKRKFSGKDYIVHPLSVANLVSRYTNNGEVIEAAILHDTIEDTDTTYQEIQTTFNTRVANLVQELSNDPDQIKSLGKTVYMRKKMGTLTPEALLIKLADRLDNVSDFAEPSFREVILKDEKTRTWALNYATQSIKMVAIPKNCPIRVEPEHASLVCEIIKMIISLTKFLTEHGFVVELAIQADSIPPQDSQ